MKKRSVAALLGHHKKQNHRSNHRKRSFKRKVKNYLKANCFLYAPLVSHSPADLSPPLKTLIHSSAAGETLPTKEYIILCAWIYVYVYVCLNYDVLGFTTSTSYKFKLNEFSMFLCIYINIRNIRNGAIKERE